ncbi:ABC transporter substrate-binding protein [Bifidobacterium leontopitheci]|uniref:ABC transporter substrate-binding protein n=1 Tax=Bifidobacterium leontopitheci TaxID=2650774 RepID=A0A6I1GGQ1_9BIFI|nr:extracellular solute-binding protein [Bifidobacterium leontopitheci]KAB7790820.1 ABC transporter substrate-binding protein [Bifidobacterium leontopitheci]
MVAKKRLLAGLASLAVMGIALAGCGSSTNNSEGNGETSSNEKITLTYMHRLPDSEGMTTVDEIIKGWNDSHPNIQVKATKFNGKAAEMSKKLQTDVEAGNDPDLAQLGYAEIPEAYTNGLLQDVTQYAKQYEKDFASGPFSLMQVNGKYYGLPQDTGPLVYFYNKTEFDKLGLKVPTTQDELIATAKKAAESGKQILALEPDEAANMLSGLSGAAGGWYKVEDNKWVVNTDTKGSKAVAKVYQELLDAKALNTNPRWDPSFDASLQKGELIGTIGAGWEAPLIMSSIGDSGKGQWQVAQLGDWFDNGGKTGPDGGSGVVVMKNSKHPKEAMEFLDWFNTQVEGLISQGLVVAAKSDEAKTLSTWSEYFGGQDIMKEFITANDNMGDFTYIPGYSAVGTAMNEAAAKAADGSGKVSDIFSAAQTTSIDSLKSKNLSVKE